MTKNLSTLFMDAPFLREKNECSWLCLKNKDCVGFTTNFGYPCKLLNSSELVQTSTESEDAVEIWTATSLNHCKTNLKN